MKINPSHPDLRQREKINLNFFKYNLLKYMGWEGLKNQCIWVKIVEGYEWSNQVFG